MTEHVPNVQCTCSMHCKMGDEKNERVMTDTVLPNASFDVRYFVFKEMN